jgi:hypothetical protein
LSYEDIGAALGIAPGAARVRVHRARLKLAVERERRASANPAPPAEPFQPSEPNLMPKESRR